MRAGSRLRAGYCSRLIRAPLELRRHRPIDRSPSEHSPSCQWNGVGHVTLRQMFLDRPAFASGRRGVWSAVNPCEGNSCFLVTLQSNSAPLAILGEGYATAELF